MTTITLQCAHCGRPISMTDTTSIWRPDGHPYNVYHSDCYKETHHDK